MFLLKKIFAAFLLPPGLFVLALAGLAVYLRKRCRPAAVACTALAALLWAGSTEVFSDALLRPLEGAYKTPARPEGDVIILLCGGFRGGWKPFSASERLAPGTLERGAAAYKLQRETGLPVLISGGAPFSSEPEAEAAAAFLRELGVPGDKLLTEVLARDTRENAEYSGRICRERGYKKAILITSAFHMPRAALLFGRLGGVDLEPFPVARRAGGPRWLRDWLPGSGEDTRRALNEYAGLLYYRLRFAFVGPAKIR
ncbi:MAG: YdcF family protein [Elusimicrobiales bacterium]